MIRFVDLTQTCWVGGKPFPVCAFLHTQSGRFISDRDGSMVFGSPESVDRIPGDDIRSMCLSLVPEGFFAITPSVKEQDR